MALTDNFNSYTDGNTLDSTTDWETFNDTGTGVPTLDEHNDHSNGTLVVDMSNTGGSYCIHQTQVGSNDHYAEVDVFFDSDSSHENKYGVLLRLNNATYGSSALDGYRIRVEKDGASDYRMRIYRIDNDATTQLAESANINGSYSFGSAMVLIRGEISGSTITGYIEGTEILSTTDTTYSTGEYVGAYSYRDIATANSQPFFDDFDADTLGGAISLVLADLTSTSTLDSVALAQQHNLIIQGATSSSTLDAVALTQQNSLVIQEALSSSSLDNVILSQSTNLVIAELTSSSTLDAVVLTQQHSLTVQELLSSSTVDTTALTQANTLVVADSLSSSTVDNVVLSQGLILTVADSLSTSTLDTVAVTQANTLVVQDSLYSSTFDNIALSQANTLVVAESLSSSTVDNITLGQGSILVIDGLLSSSNLDGVTVTATLTNNQINIRRKNVYKYNPFTDELDIVAQTQAIRSMTTDDSTTNADDVILLNSLDNSVTATLHDVTTAKLPIVLIAIKATNPITVATTSSQQIRRTADDSATTDSLAEGDILKLTPVATYWQVTS